MNSDGWVKKEDVLLIMQNEMDKVFKEIVNMQKRFILSIILVVLLLVTPPFLFCCFWAYGYFHSPPIKNYLNNSYVENSMNEGSEIYVGEN